MPSDQADSGPVCPPMSGKPAAIMMAGMALFIVGAVSYQAKMGLPERLCSAVCAAGMPIYIVGWYQAFRAKINADWFSRALNILGLVFFLILGGMLLYRMWQTGV